MKSRHSTACDQHSKPPSKERQLSRVHPVKMPFLSNVDEITNNSLPRSRLLTTRVYPSSGCDACSSSKSLAEITRVSKEGDGKAGKK